LIGILFLAT